MSIGPNKTCTHCGRHGFMGASINGKPYCHDDDRSCYVLVSQTSRMTPEERDTYINGDTVDRLNTSIRVFYRHVGEALDRYEQERGLTAEVPPAEELPPMDDWDHFAASQLNDKEQK
ncbi:hypothetical protein ACFP47_09340 [Nesterenkonia lacusekhoensis]|uniref:Uncharacterized protein n=1 Tax=Nesterenkonia lacusekhoensis TaxID=150832 RepID=A0ABS4T289_9MICC|nr:hypothetical protein [Nesterenkonia lacusekhoensis]MBP2317381.1 hypothetical protein [Nesterenkonia lacusekhoensis]